MELPKKGIYRHFKGGRYELIDVARHSETQEEMVVYRALYGEGGLWVRPLRMWSEVVERDGRSYMRFVPEEEYLRAQAEAELSTLEPPPDVEAFAPPEDEWFAPDAPARVSPKGSAEDKRSLLKRVYGYDSFREGQEEIVDSILSGRDTLGILPTGAGKSICYQLPAQLLDGVSLVVSPLISLMKDQVRALSEAGVPAAYLNSSLTERQFDAALRRLSQGRYRIVYVAPERLLTPRFLNAVSRVEISMLAVDEAHCISQWGQDFRPSYMEIPQFLDKLPHRPRLCAFTATATERVRSDIIRLLEMRDPFVRVTGFNRPNLYLSVCYTYDKPKKLLELMRAYRGFSGIVYCGTRKGVESVCEKLLAEGYPATRYHAGLAEEERQRNQEDFIYDRAPIMVATNAFGMGIDKSNVRFVIHYNMPKDLESYYQEAGRGGRDGERADCHLLFEPRDVALQRFFIDHMGEETELDPEALRAVQESARARLNAMARYCRSGQCLRGAILRYFGERAPESCGYCSNCLDPRPMADLTREAKFAVECVRECGGRFGAQMVVDVLRGADTERIRSFRLTRLNSYGALQGMSAKNIRYMIDEMLEAQVLRSSEDDGFPLLKCGPKADALMDGDMELRAYQEEIKPKAAAPSREKLPEDVDPALFEALREERAKLAQSRSVPPYIICNDATLIDMCRRLPDSLEEMIFVRGMGERKVQSVGRNFVKRICAYRAEKGM